MIGSWRLGVPLTCVDYKLYQCQMTYPEIQFPDYMQNIIQEALQSCLCPAPLRPNRLPLMLTNFSE
jgi:hypothetical protein